jgi:hypothetical protein
MLQPKRVIASPGQGITACVQGREVDGRGDVRKHRVVSKHGLSFTIGVP